MHMFHNSKPLDTLTTIRVQRAEERVRQAEVRNGDIGGWIRLRRRNDYDSAN